MGPLKIIYKTEVWDLNNVLSTYRVRARFFGGFFLRIGPHYTWRLKPPGAFLTFVPAFLAVRLAVTSVQVDSMPGEGD